MKLILHIGTEKTGTTTTQLWAARNRDALISQGVYYSSVLGAASHIKLYLWCLASDRLGFDDGFSRIAVTSKSGLQEFRNRLPAEFAAEVEKARSRECHTFLISNEHCHSRLHTPEEVTTVRDFLAPHFERIDLLCSLRPQIDLAVSRASTAARVGGRFSRDSFDKVRAATPYYNYMSFVDRWSAVFGPDHVILVPFRRIPSLPEFVVAHAQLDASLLEPPVRLNSALDIGVIAMINAMDRERSRDARRADPVAHIPSGLLNSLPFKERLQPGLKRARGIQARFADSNSRLVRGRSDIEAADLEPDWSRYDSPDNLAMLEQPCAFGNQLCELVEIFNQHLALARAEKELARAECDIGKRHPAVAQRRLKVAERLLAQLDNAAVHAQKIALLRERSESLMGMLSQDSAGEQSRRSHGRRAALKSRRRENRTLARAEEKMAEAEGIAKQKPAAAERRLKTAERLLAEIDPAAAPLEKVALLRKRAESLAGLLSQAPSET